MDSPSINHVSLCSGYGGIDLGLRRCISNLRTIAYAEIEAFACELLLARMEGGQLDAAPIWTDLKSFPWGKFHGCVDILSGGYPCQPFSSAGRRRGQEDPRHLWPFIADGIRILRPRVCFFENVEGHITLGLRDVLHDLAGMGYRTTWGLFSAAECGAPHQRKRVFILAHCKGTRLEGLGVNSGQPENAGPRSGGQLWPSRPGQPQFAWEPPRVVANARGQKPAWLSQSKGRDESAKAGIAGAGLGDASSGQDDRRESRNLGETGGQRRCGNNAVDCASEGLGDASDPRSPQRRSGAIQQPGAVQEPKRPDAFDERQTQPALGGNADGTADRMDDAELYVTCDNRIDELRLLGNGVVPATAELAFCTLSRELSP